MKTKRTKPPAQVIIHQEAYCHVSDRRYGAISVNGKWFTSVTPTCAADAISINSSMEEIVEAFKR